MIKKFLFSLVAFVAMAVTAPADACASMPQKNIRIVVAELQAKLPLQVIPGMLWTGYELEYHDTVLHTTFLIDPKELGSEESMLRMEFTDMTNEECKGFLGDDFNRMLQELGLNAHITIEFTNGWTKDFYFER